MFVAAAMMLAGAAAMALAGCGGSGSSSAERTKLEHELSAQAKTSSIPPDVTPCLVQEAGKLPLDQLRAVASPGANPPAATKRLAVGLLTTCIREGKGLSALHTLIVQSLEKSVSANVPPVFKQCLIEKANATTAGQLSQLVSTYAAGDDPAAAQKQAFQVGVGLGKQCVADPRIVDALRSLFIAPIKAAFKTSSYSTAFKNCVLKKSEQFPVAKLRQAALNPAGAQSLGETFGRNAARACIAAGARP